MNSSQSDSTPDARSPLGVDHLHSPSVSLDGTIESSNSSKGLNWLPRVRLGSKGDSGSNSVDSALDGNNSGESTPKEHKDKHKHGHSHGKAEFKKLVSSVFSRIQGTDAFRKMKLRHNTDANVKLVKDLREAVYLKPGRKLNEHHYDDNISSAASEESEEGHHHHHHHPRPKRHVCFGEYVQEILFRGSVMGEQMNAACCARDSVLDILGVGHEESAIAQAVQSGEVEESDDVLEAVQRAFKTK